MLPNLLAVKARPEDAGRVQQLQAGVDADPLLAAGDPGLVPGDGGTPSGYLIYKGRLAHIRDTENHNAQGPAHLSLALELFEPIREQTPHGRRKVLHALAAFGVRLQNRQPPPLEIPVPALGNGGIGQVTAVEDHKARLCPGQAVDVRVAAGTRDAGVEDLAHRVHHPDIFFDHPLGLGHMTGEPLDGHFFIAVLRHYFTSPSSLSGKMTQ